MVNQSWHSPVDFTTEHCQLRNSRIFLASASVGRHSQFPLRSSSLFSAWTFFAEGLEALLPLCRSLGFPTLGEAEELEEDCRLTDCFSVGTFGSPLAAQLDWHH